MVRPVRASSWPVLVAFNWSSPITFCKKYASFRRSCLLACRFSAERVEQLIREIQECSESWADIPAVYQHPWDPDDSPYINLALAAGARLIATRDRHLLDLMNATIPESRAFRRRFPELEILRPEQLLEKVRAG
jgi:predicted nucleic acid-binding protein